MAIQGVRGEERKDEGKEGRGQKSWVMDALVKIPEPVALLEKCAQCYEVESSHGTEFWKAKERLHQFSAKRSQRQRA